MRRLVGPALSLISLAVLSLGACSGSERGVVDPKLVDTSAGTQLTVRLATRHDTLRFGQSRSYVAFVTDAAGATQSVTPVWSSTDPAVLSVSFGSATAIGFGSANLIASYGTSADTATVLVPVAGWSLQLSPAAVAASLI